MLVGKLDNGFIAVWQRITGGFERAVAPFDHFWPI
jgi:hypothetical protein